MKTKNLVTCIALATLLGVTIAVPAKAGEYGDASCDVSLNYDINLTPKKLVFSQDGKEFYRFEPGRVFVEGKEVSLTPLQANMVDTYADSVAKQVPEAVALISDAMTLASGAVGTALTPLLGDETSVKVSQLVSKVRDRLDDVMRKDGDNYFIGVTDTSVDEVFNNEFEQEIDNLVQESMGTLMIRVGSEMLASDGESFDAKMEAFGKKMETMGEQIEREVGAQAQILEARAEKMCGGFEHVLKLETDMKSEVPELAKLSLGSSKPAELSE